MDWRRLARRLLVCNPFFLCSAALLLLGVYQLSVDPRFLGDETQKLYFNFGTLQVYGVLLAATAILLAARRVWYDSALLVTMEHGLVLAPFILLSGAALNDAEVAAGLAAAGAGAAVLRGAAVRRWYPLFNLPGRALVLGVGLLAANVALPLWFRAVVNATSVVDWPGPNRWIWLVGLPVAAAGANLLPRAAERGGTEPERRWLPLFIYSLWLGGTTVHVLAVAYLGKGAAITTAMVAPLLTVLGWTAYRRLADVISAPRRELAGALLVLALAVAGPFFAAGEEGVMFPLALANVAGFAALARARNDFVGLGARWFAGVSAVALILAVPASWIPLAPTAWPAREIRCLILGASAVVLSWRSRKPAAGLAGAAGLFWAMILIDDRMAAALGWQLGLLAALAHSTRWAESNPGAARLRFAIAALWAWSVLAGPVGPGFALGPGAQGLGLLLIWAVVWKISGRRPAWVLPVAGVLGLVSHPAGAGAVQAAPGLVALASSFALFAVGAVFAWRRPRRSE